MKLKIAIISDVHGNKEALQAVLYDIISRGIDTIFNLGDSLYGPIDQAGTVKLLMQHKINNIMGNCDRMLFEPTDNPSPTINFVKDNLSIDHLNWLKEHPASVVFDDIFFCHGTPKSDEVYLLEEMTKEGGKLKSLKEIEMILKDVTQNVIFCGHSHVPRIVYLPNGKIVVNPVSVGLPAYYDELPIPHKMESYTPHAKYTILQKTAKNWLIEQINVTYDWEKAANYAINHGREDWAKSLLSGMA